MLYAALLLTGADLAGAHVSHRWLGPLVAGFLSIAGAAAADRVRRSVFEHEREVETSAERLRQEVEVDEALARVGQELIALPDTRRILDALCRLTTEVLACDASHTYLWDAERQEYSAAAGYGDTPEQWEALRLVRYPQRMVREFQERIEAGERRAVRPRREPAAAGGAAAPVQHQRGAVRGAAPRRQADRRAERRAPRSPPGVHAAAGPHRARHRTSGVAGAGDRAPGRGAGGGQPAQVRVRRHHVARAALAAEHHHRLPRAAARRRLRPARRVAARPVASRRPQRARAARPDQRHARPEPSGGEAHRARPRRRRGGRAGRRGGPGARRRARAPDRRGALARAARPAAAAHRPGEAQDGAEEPGRECGEVHRAGPRARWRPARATAGWSSASPTPASASRPRRRR